ncbi:MAG: tetratricopeptide repeat protein [Burkholderiaceae bacterium]|jgi:tetratricopeptide (TPR) repeat protein|nr:tetratricopeptide repeat protein [Burkholderiaceae bacterium]
MPNPTPQAIPSKPSRLTLARRAKRSFSTIAVSAGVACAAVWASTHAWSATQHYADIKQALSTGESARALELVKKAKNDNPKDVQLMFFEGVIKAQTGDTRGAIALFEDMTEKYPELPEPHNNLGVLFAAKGDLEKAKAAFERAILTNPSYAAAHKNMADVYAALAKKNYGKALQVDGANTPNAPQMTLLGNLTPGAKPQDNVIVAMAKPAAATPAQAESNTQTQAATPAASAPAGASDGEKATAKAEQDIKDSVLIWAAAWSARDIDSYLSAYSASFDPGRGLTLGDWKQQRTERIVPRKRINVKIVNLRVNLNGKTATADFSQAYTSDTFNGTSVKRLDMVLEGGRWLIAKESVR